VIKIFFHATILTYYLQNKTKKVSEMKDLKICVVGLGYVGLPLAYNFAKQGIETIGYDVREEKLEEYRNGVDRTEEVGADICNVGINFTSDPKEIGNANYVIVAVPTPTINGTPELKYLEMATNSIGKYMSKNTTVVYESTVYPFCTERFCLKILKENTNLVYNEDFFIGFSPERISPGDKINTVTNILK
jgi:UDP-N-acetyl-D-galactosamine dehydrogenase